MEIRREPKASDGTNEEEGQDVNVLGADADAQDAEIGDKGSKKEPHCCQEVGVYIDSLVVNVEEAGIRFPVTPRATSIGAVYELIVSLPWLYGVPYLKQAHPPHSLHWCWILDFALSL